MKPEAMQDDNAKIFSSGDFLDEVSIDYNNGHYNPTFDGGAFNYLWNKFRGVLSFSSLPNRY